MKDHEHDRTSTRLEIDWNWEAANYLAEWHEPIVELLSRYIRRNSRILEVGAGGSHTLGALAGRLQCKAFGVEPDLNGTKKTIEFAYNEETANVTMIRGDGFFLPFADKAFDVVYSLGLVEHFEQKQTDALLAEHFRVCRSGGIVIVGVPNLLNLPHSLRKAYLGSAYEYGPERSYTPRKLKRILAASGLQSIRTDGLNPLWGLGMSPVGSRIVRLFTRVGVARLLNGVQTPALRAALGFMTFAICERVESESEAKCVA